MKIKPFADEDGYTAFSNYLLDVIMPSLPANAWKVLCFVIRKTRGWQKDMDRLSYRQIEEGAGIGSSATVSAAIKVLLEKELIVKVPGNAWTSMGYQLNSSLETEALDNSTSETKALETEAHGSLETEAPVLQKLKTQKERIKKDLNKERGAPAQVNIDSLHEGVTTYKRLTGKRTVTPSVAAQIAAAVTDIPQWEAVITAWCGKYRAENVNGMLDWYAHPDKMKVNNGPLRHETRNGRHPDPRTEWQGFTETDLDKPF